MTIFWILGIIFAASGIYLYLYSQKRSRLIRDFASSRGLSYSCKADESLERELEDAFGFDIPGITRSFSRIRDVVQYEGIRIFRATELLELNPHGTSQNTHFGRIAAYFDMPAGLEMYFLVSPKLEYSNRHPTQTSPSDDSSFIKMQETLAKSLPRYHLSVSSARGKGILYLEPALGSEKKEDLEYLFDLACTLYRRVWSKDT